MEKQSIKLAPIYLNNNLNCWEFRALALIKFMTFIAHFKTKDSWSGIFLVAKTSLCMNVTQFFVFSVVKTTNFLKVQIKV